MAAGDIALVGATREVGVVFLPVGEEESKISEGRQCCFVYLLQ